MQNRKLIFRKLSCNAREQYKLFLRILANLIRFHRIFILTINELRIKNNSFNTLSDV